LPVTVNIPGELVEFPGMTVPALDRLPETVPIPKRVPPPMLIV
jgi:hypothetical protein